MNSHVQIVAQLSKVNLWNKENQKMEPMYNAREEIMNILDYINFSKLFHAIKYFPELNNFWGNEDITFPLSPSPRAIEWQKQYLHEFDSCVDKIDTIAYHDFTIDKFYFKEESK